MLWAVFEHAQTALQHARVEHLMALILLATAVVAYLEFRVAAHREVFLYEIYPSSRGGTPWTLVDPRDTARPIRAFREERGLEWRPTDEQDQRLREVLAERLTQLLAEKSDILLGDKSDILLLDHHLAAVRCANTGACDGWTVFELYQDDMRYFGRIACGVLEKDAKELKEEKKRDEPIVKFLVDHGLTEKDFLCEHQRKLARELTGARR